VSEFVTDKLVFLMVYPRIIHILNRRGSALVHLHSLRVKNYSLTKVLNRRVVHIRSGVV